jgi:4-pyridoxolactonase
MGVEKVYLLDGGTLVIDGLHVFWNAGPAGEVRFPCYSVLVQHSEGFLLYDTGYDKAHVEKVLPFEKPIQSDAQTIPGQLALLGLAPSDITHVVNSHYHFDHCGGNHLCTHAKTLCHEVELDAAKNPQPFEKLGYSDASFDMGANYELLSGDAEIFDGVELFETPGHTAGHLSMLVRLKGRSPMLFTGDACYTKESLDRNVISSFHLDPVASVQSLQRIRDVAQENEADIFFSHDAASYGDYKLAPVPYL